MNGSAFRGLEQSLRVVFYVWVVAVIGFVTLLGYVLWNWTTEPNWQFEAISRGYAIYCPDNGEFAWIGECEASQ